MDSLRYWVLEMHVDGFRFDLASALARELHEVDRLSAFFDLIQQDPILSQVKLIAEAWDVGEGGYQVGNFPPVWSEWNGKYRDTMRDFWRGEGATLGEYASRFTGSSDLYQHDSRSPFASINFITAHDGFTLHDLVSYNDKHNEPNGEGNRDGDNNNRSWNCGEEGPTDNPEVIGLRAVQKRNLLATLLLSQGVPMVVAGDELGRTQRGNNNAYCQDNEISWIDWPGADTSLLDFARHLVGFRQRHPVFRQRHWFQGQPIRSQTNAADAPDIAWLRPDGRTMSDENWGDPSLHSIGVFLNGDTIRAPDEQGRQIVDDSFLVLSNAWWQPIEWTLPGQPFGDRWEILVDTFLGVVRSSTNSELPEPQSVSARVTMPERSLLVLRRLPAGPGGQT